MGLRGSLALAAACVLAGCSEEPLDRAGSAGWTKPNLSPAEFQSDSDACRHNALMAPTRSTGPAGPAAERRLRYNDCMIARGWTLDPHISKDRSLDVVDCKLPSVEQVQRMSARECMNRLGKVL